ncbi:hypothetical protein J2790_002899 [Paenarthrobacter nicotinovorans]|uniref:DUF6318 family protein n=1 Tax=Micrococcaceae TaxID=1268 RepID=UPI0008768E03|nr:MULTISPECIES: DUF6318 family protein [Micrococcaceae]MDR6437750.1 hypothetical protein [Paenarthrobacter nicotinovorans]SCZ61417.1 hypothetical protein SAMN02799638_03187 [Arthrobacter sp. UNCCL28]
MPRLSSATFPVALPRTAALAVGLALLLTGCQGGSPPGLQTSESGSTTVSPTSSSAVPAASATSSAPSPSAVYKPADAKGKAQNVPVPVMPELAKENSKAGLEAFIGYWYAQLSYVGETGDMSSWLPLISQDCRLCLRLQESGEDGYIDGRWLVGGKISVPVVEVLWRADSVQSAKVQVIQQQIDYYNADGSVGRSSSEASNDAFALFATYVDGSWIVVDLGVIS